MSIQNCCKHNNKTKNVKEKAMEKYLTSPEGLLEKM